MMVLFNINAALYHLEGEVQRALILQGIRPDGRKIDQVVTEALPLSTNRNYQSLLNLVPGTTKAAFQEIVEVLKIDILQVSVKGRIHIGHNRLAGLIYFITTFIFFFPALTGFALYGPTSHSILGKLAAWVVPLMGSEAVVRQWHHAMLWFYVLFVMVHVYLVFYHDYVEGRGTTSSMVGGWKFEREDRLDH